MSAVAMDRAGEARLYDFRRPTTLVREHSRTLELAFDTFARQWGTQLTAKIRVLSQVTFQSVRMLGYDEYASGLPATTAMILLGLSDVEPRAVLQFPTPSALTWINSMLGGTRPVQPVERTFTPIEYALVRHITDDALEDLKYSLGPLLPGSIRVDSIQYHSQFAQAAPTTELMVIARFTLRVGDNEAEASLALPWQVLLPQLGEANPTVPSDDATHYLRRQLVQVPIEVAASLDPAYVTPSEVLSLKVGDVLRLPHPTHHPLNLVTGEQRVASVAIGTSRSRLAVVVTDLEEGA
ncbi:MAG TPA: flagellar motor switch protein FliM [Microbacteriaceae bacterium]|nr:flagellar motor switch protein FliM [Microbacteriaceae bacterium]